VGAVLGTTTLAPDQPRAVAVRRRLEEELIILQLPISRLRTPDFVAWATKNDVLLRDIGRAAERLRHSVTGSLVDLTGD